MPIKSASVEQEQPAIGALSRETLDSYRYIIGLSEAGMRQSRANVLFEMKGTGADLTPRLAPSQKIDDR
jgi:hypothetical protein